jgi:Fur family ferric uptake transcriptional regulator
MNLQKLLDAGIKVTKHKIAILQLFDLHKHLDANQIHSLLSIQGNDISQATIYRVLSTFEEHHIIAKHNFREDQSIYELADPETHHDHLICIRCNHMIEFFDSTIEQIQEQIAAKNKFTIVDHSLTLYGICETCATTTPPE